MKGKQFLSGQSILKRIFLFLIPFGILLIFAFLQILNLMIFQSEKPIIQIAYTVKDVRQAAQIWSNKFNIGPFYVNEHIPLANSYVRGVAEPFDHSSAYGWQENLMIELICDHAQKISPIAIPPDKPIP